MRIRYRSAQSACFPPILFKVFRADSKVGSTCKRELGAELLVNIKNSIM